MTIAGIDPSLTSTGIAIADNGIFTTHRIQSKGSKTATWDQRRDRLADMATRIAGQIPSESLVVIESPSYASVGGSSHDRSGLWWMIYDRLATRGCTLIPVAPTQRMKYATGKGRADKDQVLAAAIKRYPHIAITGNDVADAVLFMAIGCRIDGTPIEDNLPKTHIDALAKLQLPVT